MTQPQHTNSGCWYPFRRLYIRKVVKYGERPKWTPVGWYCDRCGAVALDDH